MSAAQFVVGRCGNSIAGAFLPEPFERVLDKRERGRIASNVVDQPVNDRRINVQADEFRWADDDFAEISGRQQRNVESRSFE